MTIDAFEVIGAESIAGVWQGGPFSEAKQYIALDMTFLTRISALQSILFVTPPVRGKLYS